MCAITALLAFPCLLLMPPQETPAAPRLDQIDRVRLAEAFRLGDAIGDRIWPGWSKAPFAVLFITPEWEYLIRHPSPSKDFTLLGDDQLLGGKVWYRKRTLPIALQATFPVAGITPTAVVGKAEHTQAKTSTRWVVTLLHEHFHQWQMSNPRYYADVTGLNLAGDDKSGMWMLNYPFPYQDEAVCKQVAVMAQALTAALNARGKPEFKGKADGFLKLREQFRAMLKPADFKYASFQLWQEGIARYTEWHVADFAATHYQPSNEFAALPDFEPYREELKRIERGIEKQLQEAKLESSRRELFYPLGAAEGLLLDQLQPQWRQRYLTEMFFLNRYYRPLP